MSETKNIPEKTLNYVACGIDEEIKILAANEQNIDGVPGIPLVIEAEDFTVTNETKDGRTEVINTKTGELIGYLEEDGTLNRKLEEMDKIQGKEQGDR